MRKLLILRLINKVNNLLLKILNKFKYNSGIKLSFIGNFYLALRTQICDPVKYINSNIPNYLRRFKKKGYFFNDEFKGTYKKNQGFQSRNIKYYGSLQVVNHYS